MASSYNAVAAVWSERLKVHGAAQIGQQQVSDIFVSSASTSGTLTPAARNRRATCTNGRQSSCSGGASITMRGAG